jgi:hypothetical protein
VRSRGSDSCIADVISFKACTPKESALNNAFATMMIGSSRHRSDVIGETTAS